MSVEYMSESEIKSHKLKYLAANYLEQLKEYLSNRVCSAACFTNQNIDVASRVKQALLTTSEEFVELDPLYTGVTVEYVDKADVKIG